MIGTPLSLPFCSNELLWGDGELVIRNPSPEVLGVLKYTHRSLELNEKTYKKDIVKDEVLLYREVEPGVITTFQGFLDKVIETCNEHGQPYKFADMRLPMPAPRIDKIGNFRFGQRLLFLQALAKNRSGLIKAPTRYGKTVLIANAARAYEGLKTVITAPGVDLLKQLQADLQRWLPKREITGIYTGSKGKKVSEDITVVSMDSIHKADLENTRLLLIDEPHSAVSASRVTEMLKFRRARIMGFGATLTGRFDGGDKLITGVIGPVLSAKTYQEAVTEGAICAIDVFMVKIKFTPFPAFRREDAYRKLIYRNASFNTMVRQLSAHIIPPEWQTLIFVDEIKQAELMESMVQDGVVAVASKMNKEERKQKYDDMVRNVIKRCIATEIYATGITFPDLRVIVNAAGGGGSITATQKPGRLAQVRPGKRAGYLIDFLFVPDSEPNFGQNNEWRAIPKDCYARMESYKRTGFNVKTVNYLREIQLT